MESPAATSAPRRLWCAVVCCVATGLAVCGCGVGANGGAGVRPGTVAVGVTEHDFGISATVSHVSAGEVTLRIHNQGPDQHELIVAPWRSGGLPLRSDGFTINEEAIQSSEPGSITPQQPGRTQNLIVHFPPGRYVLFCNMEGHYMGGMHTTLVVD